MGDLFVLFSWIHFLICLPCHWNLKTCLRVFFWTWLLIPLPCYQQMIGMFEGVQSESCHGWKDLLQKTACWIGVPSCRSIQGEQGSMQSHRWGKGPRSSGTEVGQIQAESCLNKLYFSATYHGFFEDHRSLIAWGWQLTSQQLRKSLLEMPKKKQMSRW